MSDSEIIKIANCPICGTSHIFGLNVERSMYFAFLTTSSIPETPQSIRYTRLFTCPVKQTDFQVKFVLKQTSISQIKSVTVMGLVQESSDE